MVFGRGKQKKNNGPASMVPDDDDLLERLEERDLLDDQERIKKKRMASNNKKGKNVDKDLEEAKKLFHGIGGGGDDDKQVLTPDQIVKRDPEKLFYEMDVDNSGSIEFEEFRELLAVLGVKMTEAKASRYFKTLDSDGSGALGLEEFKAALFACDPDSGNSIGFTPSATLGPKDAFKMFDDDGSGHIDEDEFGDVLEYLSLPVTNAKQEKLFKKYDKDKSGYIEYNEFRKIWLSVADVRAELEKRGVTFGKRTPKAVMIRRLEEILDEEEQMEEHALAQAKAWRDWQAQQNEKQSAFEAAKRRAKEELMQALDCAGQVYVFGVGAHGQFSADSSRASSAFKHFETIQELWKSRVMPQGPVDLKYRNIGQVSKQFTKRTVYPLSFNIEGVEESNERGRYNADQINDLPGRDEIQDLDRKNEGSSRDFRFPKRSSAVIDKIVRGAEFGIPEDSSSEESSDEEAEWDTEGDSDDNGADSDDDDDDRKTSKRPRTVPLEVRRASESPFVDMICAPNCSALWGRRVIQVAAGINTAFALTDQGQILAWGGRDQWWTEVRPQQTAASQRRGHLTQRSQLMLGMVGEDPWADVSEPDLTLDETESEIYARLKVVTNDYYGVWEPCPHQGLKMPHMENIILAKLSFDEVALSLTMRGFDVSGLNKRQMIDKVYQAVVVERDNIGWKAMRAFRAAEIEIKELKEAKKTQKADAIESVVKSIWRPLHAKVREWNEVVVDQRIKARDRREEMHHDQYCRWRSQLADEAQDRSTPGVMSLITERGSGPKMFRKNSLGFSALEAGAFHVAGVSSLGQTYTWGDGNFGRLGQGQGPGLRGHSEWKKEAREGELNVITAAETAAVVAKASASRFDVGVPSLVQDLTKTVIKQVACGYSHTAAVSNSGELFAWGGANDGKLGVGPVTEEYECYCPYPVRVSMPSEAKVAQVSCGNAHSACVSTEGHLYVWGSTDSGRLGLGKVKTKSVDRPTIVQSLRVAGCNMRMVSCGCTHTAACTTTRRMVEGKGVNKVKRVVGGHVYVAGPAAVLGKARPKFHLVKELYDKPVKQVSCGYGITGCVTADGELYTWGMNKSGCIGHSIHKKFVRKPKLVKALYSVPKNLALGRRTRQSSVYNKRSSEFAVNGNRCGDGERNCIHTQVDTQPFWEVDLGKICVVEKIHLWNREDSPPDGSSPPDMFTKRLFPCWVLVSATPFDPELVNAYSNCAAKKKFTTNMRRSVWNLPANIAGRFVRVQLEQVNYLHFAELEVFGTPGLQKSVSKISSVQLGKEVTIAVVDPCQDMHEVDAAYQRAVKADPGSALILRQYPTFFKSWDKHGYGESIVKCPLDRGSMRCEMCLLKNGWPSIKYPPGPKGRLRRLESMGKILIEDTLPPLNWEVIKPKTEGAVANMLAAVDNLKGFFNKSGGKLLMARKIASEKFNITLHEAEISGTDYLTRQFAKLKEEDDRDREDLEKNLAETRKERRTQERKFKSLKESEYYDFACIACDICCNFEPLQFNPKICKVCTHVQSTHTKKTLKIGKTLPEKILNSLDWKKNSASDSSIVTERDSGARPRRSSAGDATTDKGKRKTKSKSKGKTKSNNNAPSPRKTKKIEIAETEEKVTTPII